MQIRKWVTRGCLLMPPDMMHLLMSWGWLQMPTCDMSTRQHSASGHGPHTHAPDTPPPPAAAAVFDYKYQGSDRGPFNKLVFVNW